MRGRTMTLGRRLALHAEENGTPTSRPTRTDPLTQLRDRTRETLARDLGKRLGGAEQNATQLRLTVAGELERMIAESTRLLNPAEREQLAHSLIDDVLGYGPIEPLLNDPTVSEVMVNGKDNIFAERNGKVELTSAKFRSDDHLRQIIVRIAAAMGRRIDESSPMVDARLADGSRVNAVIPPLAVDGPSLTIRKFAADTLTAEDLVAKGSLTREAMTLLSAAVKGQLNVIVSGGTGTGKTTFLNILSSFIPPGDRIVTIEDAVELKLRQRHVVRLECKTANIEGKGAIGTRELVRNSLRMRPDRIIVGECRGAEALDMLQAMNTGHDGSLGTLHANNPEDALTRLETMVLMTGLELPPRAIREQLASAVDVIVQLERLRDGSRVVTAIAEVLGIEDEHIQLNYLFQRHYDEESGQTSELRRVGSNPSFAQKLAKNGVILKSLDLG
jgi:pilus assembly protein CpaF